ncbi:GNAT family N-acetyltransferase [Pseudohalocynthiibacter aestuariivivens]|jgi:acetyltransferase|uniref:GNAT family N-acetyltransferase n=1 Tax=Pseudohalocynthiibacter aestuariivivens TaxID=1591409 RepID=A0ABV5JJQ5_9RHOB|nr:MULTISPECIES: GNAT family N-acetyltransferase [Pseudohalocynthiibacter]MBS9717566.1 GNAT family N-acetyltransferase [Pseudohalocynthiibacter aestuariivivens]MCK0102764.1 GNAT family N-acetyltransferase [Pseudohalocynthiibacter sp. F2068]
MFGEIFWNETRSSDSSPVKIDEGVTIRRLVKNDVGLLREFFRGLSKPTLFWRFMSPVHEISEKLLHQLADTKHDRHYALIAEHEENGHRRTIAEARYVRDQTDPAKCEFAISIADEMQGRGLGSVLLQFLEKHASINGVLEMTAETLRENTAMVRLAKGAGYSVVTNFADPRMVKLKKALNQSDPASQGLPHTHAKIAA